MFKGTKKAIARTPHRLIGGFTGAKSEEDEVVASWVKDFAVAEAVLDELEAEVKGLVGAWRQVAEHQTKYISQLREIYMPIEEPNAYREVQKTPESTLRPISEFESEVITSFDADVLPYVTSLESQVATPLKEARKCIASVRKALTKREHKKVDYDRHNASFLKVQQKYSSHTAGEKEAAEFVKHEEQVDVALEAFLSQDEKVKKYVPHVLNVLSELLNLLSSIMFLSQLHATEALKNTLKSYTTNEGFAVSSGKTTGLDPYSDVIAAWEERFVPVQMRAEQAIVTIENGEAVKRPMDKPTAKVQDRAKNLADKTWESTQDFSKNTVQLLKHPHGTKPALPFTSSGKVAFSSTEFGMFGTAADILTGPGGAGDGYRRYLSQSPKQSNRQSRNSGQLTVGSPLPSILSTSSVHSPPQVEATSGLLTRVRAFSSSSARALSPQSGRSNSVEEAPFVVPQRSADSEYATAQFTFEGGEPGDVSFRKGDTIRVLDHGDDVDDQWWFGETDDGRLGLFPQSYIQLKQQS